MYFRIFFRYILLNFLIPLSWGTPPARWSGAWLAFHWPLGIQRRAPSAQRLQSQPQQVQILPDSGDKRAPKGALNRARGFLEARGGS